MTETKRTKGMMTVQEAGRRGGQQTSRRHGHEFYVGIGQKGGGRMRELIEAGKKALAEKATKRA